MSPSPGPDPDPERPDPAVGAAGTVADLTARVADVAARVADVRQRIRAAAAAAGRDPATVRLIAVTKTVPLDLVAAVVAAGIVDLGENRAQELLAKAPILSDLSDLLGSPVPDASDAPDARSIRWHFIGRLQRNKIRPLAPWVSLWHSVDRLELAAPLGRLVPAPRVLVQVNVDDDPAKGGCEPGQAAAVVEGLRDEGVEVAGLMTVPRLDGDPRPAFARLRALAGQLGVVELSMGMTDDFETAIAEGATLVRVGRAIFGARS